jgi:chaperonin cofactor prefoldin
MPNQKQFNYLNFFYGFGAFIILLAAMFKFLGWHYANTIFVIGICVEACVFLISAFEWGDDKQAYNWEKVFPQLDEDNPNSLDIGQGVAEASQLQQVQQIMETVVTLNSSVTELNSATQKLTRSVGMMEKNYDIVAESTQKYQEEIDSLRNKITSANDRLKEFEKFNYTKES